MLVTVYVHTCVHDVFVIQTFRHMNTFSVLLQISIVDRLDFYQRWALIVKHLVKQQFLVH